MKTTDATEAQRPLTPLDGGASARDESPGLPAIEPGEEIWELRLYVAGQTRKSLVAQVNLKRFCAEHLEGKHHIEVVDLLEQPQRAQRDQILAIPTLVRCLPEPIRKIIGDLSNTERVLIGLDLPPKSIVPSHVPEPTGLKGSRGAT